MADAFLRRLQHTDVQAVLDAFRSSTDMRRQGDVYDLDSARIYVNSLLANDSPHLPWVIARSEGSLAGLVVVTVDQANNSGWFWYWMHASDRGRGWTSCGARTVANWALHELGVDRLELGHRANNPESGAVARAAGFVREGCEREKFLVDGQRVDVLNYGRLASDPAPIGPSLKMLDEAEVLSTPLRPPTPMHVVHE